MSEEKTGWLSRLRSGLSKSADRVGGAITGVFTKRKLDQAALDELEEILIAGDMGVTTAAKLSAAIARERFDKEVSDDEVREALADEIAGLLDPVALPLNVDAGPKPFVILVCGV
ncbi:MAG TPA: signal recognition particle-docking protein FtsY, partial [Rhodospirillaceae bacterium]|nr:signal recognition particle-docking protein FtsY [Rhodospirillaceae bacterium]